MTQEMGSLTLRRMEIAEIIAERDAAKVQAESYQKQAAHFWDLYNALDTVVRLKSEGNLITSRVASNGHKPALKIKDLIIEALTHEEGLTAQEIRGAVEKHRDDVKIQHVYNVLTDLVKENILKRKEGKYYGNKR